MADNAKFDPAKTPGTFSPPPAHAPQEITIPGSERPTHAQIAAARSNEVEMPTFAPKPMSRQAMEAMLGPAKVAELLAQQAAAGNSRPDLLITAPLDKVQPQPIVKPSRRVARPSIVLTDAEVVPSAVPAAQPELPVEIPLVVEPEPGVELPTELTTEELIAPLTVENLLPPILPHQKAASDSDSPSRGLPTASADPGKTITGGFGDLGEAQYFPLTGLELRHLVDGLMSVINQRMIDDPRFSMAVTYPRVRARVTVQVDAHAVEQSFEIPKIMPPHEKTPLEIAKARADEVVFVVVAERIEMTEDGESISPPNAIRKELGLEVPRKRAIATPSGGRRFVDVE